MHATRGILRTIFAVAAIDAGIYAIVRRRFGNLTS